MSILGMSEREIRLMPYGMLSDIVECHVQANTPSDNAKRENNQEANIDDIIPYGI